MNLRIHFDGGCYPNPGGKCSWGYTIEREASHGWETISEQFGAIIEEPRTNNIAEITAVLRALIDLARIDGVENVTVRGDSQLAINWSAGRRVKNRALTRLCAIVDEVRALVISLASRKVYIEWEWIPREQNSRCDALASRGKG